MSEFFKLIPGEADDNQRLDKFITLKVENITRSYVQSLIEQGCVLVDDKVCYNKNYKVKLNQIIFLTKPDPVKLEIKAMNIPLDIPYEDNDVLIVNKPKGMVVHPAPGNYEGTLVSALMFHCKDSLSSINGTIRPGIVHRIDKDTSGLLIVAKNDEAHKNLAKQIKDHSFLREYEAVVYGNFKESKGTIDLPIGRHNVDRKKMAVTTKNSKRAVTHFEVINQYNGFSHIKLKLETGRTHQIRVHMAYIGHPVAGDPIYGPKKIIKSLNGQCLHAKVIGFIHPKTSEFIKITSELPNYFKEFLNIIKLN